MQPTQKKCWGHTTCTDIADSPHYSRHLLRVVAGGYCSFHYHLDRSNIFHLRNGKVRIVWAYGWQLHSQILSSEFKTLSIPAGVPHQFQVLESGEMIEEYLPQLGSVRDDDIVRLTTGGTTNLVSFFDEDRPEAIWLESGQEKWTGQIIGIGTA